MAVRHQAYPAWRQFHPESGDRRRRKILPELPRPVMFPQLIEKLVRRDLTTDEAQACVK